MSVDQYDIVTERKGQIFLFVLIFAVTMIDGLDSSIVMLTLPTMADDLGVSVANSSWIINAYIIGIAAPLLVFTKLADTGRIREFFVYGTLIFGIASLWCGLSKSFDLLIIARFMQGVGASMMGSTSPIIVIRMIPADMKGRGMSVLAIASGVSLILGPPLGGLIVSAVTWNWIFYVNVPICAVAIVAGMIKLPKAREKVKGFPLDIPLAIYMGLLITSALILLENIVECTIPVWAVVACGACAAATLVLLLHRTRRDDVTDKLFEPEMFRNREFILVTASFLLTTMIAAGTEYLLPYFMQWCLGMTELESSMYFMIVSVFTVLASFAAGRWCDTRGCKMPTAIAVLFRFVFSMMFVFMVPEWGIGPLLIAMVVMGLSFGLSGTSQSTRIIHHTEPKYQGEASAVLLEANYIGAALGTVMYALVFTLNAEFGRLSETTVTDSFHMACVFGAVLAVIAMICTLSVRNIVPGKEEASE